jgi:FkbM family methyltransferase
MRAAAVVRRGLVAAMNAVPGSVAARFGTSAGPARVFRPLLNALLPTAPTTVVIRSGVLQGTRLRIDPSREKFYWTGLYEVGVQEAFVRLLRPGDTMWDVGAHIGFFAALAASRVGPGGRVHAFEPMPANRNRLLETIELNKLDQVEVHPIAVAGQTGASHLYGNSSTSMWSLVENPGEKRIDVPCATLDDLIADASFGTPALVKIDVEGTEVDVLRGGLRLLTETSVVLVVEFTDAAVLEEARALLPGHAFDSLSERHWLVRGAARGDGGTH